MQHVGGIQFNVSGIQHVNTSWLLLLVTHVRRNVYGSNQLELHVVVHYLKIINCVFSTYFK